ncbi:hypothetical protein [Longispora urticae]
MRRLRRWSIRCWAIGVPVLLAAAGCGTEPAAPDWRPVDLPATGTATVSEIARCADGWYAVGAVDGHPAAWRSADGRGFTVVPVTPRSAYGPEHELVSVACAAGRLTALGVAHGGAHGNRRSGTWSLRDGVLVEQVAPPELYGGPRDAGLARVAAGPAGFLVSGNHPGSTGWVSADGGEFRPGYADENLRAYDGAVTTAGFVLVGDRVWRSADGARWSVETPGLTLHRAATADGELLAAGPSGRRFELWGGPGWRRLVRFGDTAGTTPPHVVGLAPGPGGAYAAVASGTRLGLWLCQGDAARSVPLPVAPAHVPGARLVLATGDGQVVVGAGDGRLWFAQTR